MKNFYACVRLSVVFAAAMSASATLQTAVALGSNSAFAVVAGTTVTVTGAGTITGNIGIFPGSAFVPGVPAVTVKGTVFAGGTVAAQAQADLTTAFNDAAGRQTPVIVAGNIGGQTLTPGLYKSTSSLAISSGDLTLDAQGDANAVFIFQIASSFTMTSGRQVILAGGANAANIFWQVGSSATLGTTTVIHGTIMAAISISMLTGSTLDGRALAQSGAVSIDTGGGSSATVPVATPPTKPTVISTVPASAATGVPIGNKITATFSTAMDPATITATTFTLQQGATAVTGGVTYIGTTATFSPTINLSPLTNYTGTITTGAKDLAGNALASVYSWTFTTGATLDITPPTVTSTVPANLALGVAVGNPITAVFSKAMDPLTINASTITLRQGATTITGTVSYSLITATFVPSAPLATATVYTGSVTTGAKDLAGNALAANYTWTFTTGTVVPPVLKPVISLNGTVNVASFVAPVVAGSIAAVFGTNLATGQSSSIIPLPLPTSLGDSSFTIGGRTAPLFWVSTGQVNLQIPWELAGQTQATISTTVAGVASDPQNITLAAFGPGIFSADLTGKGQGAILVAPTAQVAAPGTPALKGGFVAIFCTGLGAVTNQPATGAAALAVPLSRTLTIPGVTIGGIPAEVTYSGLAPTLAGLYQVNAQVPAGVTSGPAVPVIISIGGVTSNTVTIAVQ